jgi:hypothetical protein
VQILALGITFPLKIEINQYSQSATENKDNIVYIYDLNH